MTAGHCLYQIVKVEVYFGAINRSVEGTGSYVRFMAVTNKRSIIVHENYDDERILNDIGLVELPQDAPVDHMYVGLLPLPTGADRTRSLVDVEATVSGFGNNLL